MFRLGYIDYVFLLILAFTIPDLEKKPLQNVTRPMKGALSRVSYGILLFIIDLFYTVFVLLISTTKDVQCDES